MAEQHAADSVSEARRTQLLTNFALRLARVLAPLSAVSGASGSALNVGAEDVFSVNEVLAQNSRLLLRSMHVLLRYSGHEHLCVSKRIRALWALAAADNEYYPLYCVLAARQVTAPGHPRLRDPQLFHLDLVKTAQDLPAGPARAEARARFRARFEQLFGIPPGHNDNSDAILMFNVPADPASADPASADPASADPASADPAAIGNTKGH